MFSKDVNFLKIRLVGYTEKYPLPLFIPVAWSKFYIPERIFLCAKHT